MFALLAGLFALLVFAGVHITRAWWLFAALIAFHLGTGWSVPTLPALRRRNARTP